MDNYSTHKHINWSLAGGIFSFSLLTNLLILSQVGYKTAPDSVGYIRVAKNFVEHGALLENDYLPGILIPFTERMPAYPAFLGGLFEIFTEESDALFAAGVSNSIFLATTAVLIFVITSYAMTARIGFFAGILAAIDPWSKLISPMILTDSMFYLATTASLCMGVFAISRKTPRMLDFFFWGVTIGLASMVRPVLNYFWIVILPIVLLNYKFKQGLYLFSICMVGFCIILGGWFYRNHQVAGFWGLQTSDGISILWSNFEFTRSSTLEDYKINPEVAKVRDMIATSNNPIKLMTPIRRDLNVSPVKVNSLFRSVGIENIIENPFKVSLIYFRNLIKTITTIFNSSGNSDLNSTYSPYVVWGEKIGSFVLFVLMPVGALFISWRKSYKNQLFFFFALVLGYILFLSSLVAGSFRYRFPAHGIFWILDAAFLSFTLDYWRSHRESLDQ